MVNCTNEKVFRVALDELTMDKCDVIKLVILADMVRVVQDLEARNDTLEQAMGQYLEMIKINQQAWGQFGLVQPIPRLVHQWYMNNFDAFRNKLGMEFHPWDALTWQRLKPCIVFCKHSRTTGCTLPLGQKNYLLMQLFTMGTIFFSVVLINLEEEEESIEVA